MPNDKYISIGGVWRNKYGYSLKINADLLPKSGEFNIYINEPHPDYKTEKSPLFGLKIKETEPVDEPDLPFNDKGDTDDTDIPF